MSNAINRLRNRALTARHASTTGDPVDTENGFTFSIQDELSVLNARTQQAVSTGNVSTAFASTVLQSVNYLMQLIAERAAYLQSHPS